MKGFMAFLAFAVVVSGIVGIVYLVQHQSSNPPTSTTNIEVETPKMALPDTSRMETPDEPRMGIENSPPELPTLPDESKS